MHGGQQDLNQEEAEAEAEAEQEDADGDEEEKSEEGFVQKNQHGYSDDVASGSLDPLVTSPLTMSRH